jgi:hypothetical protein
MTKNSTKTKKGNFGKEDFLKCNKCDTIVFGPTGASTHANRKHKIALKAPDLAKYFKVVKNPPQEIVDKIQKKKRYQDIYRASKKGQAKTGGVNYKCNACDFVTVKKNNLYDHCKRSHGKKFSEIGCIETNNPPTHRVHNKKKTPLLPNLMGQMPQLVDLVAAEKSDDGFIITVRLKISTAYVAAFILPTLSNV